MKDYILSFCKEFGYPTEAEAALASAYDNLCQHQEAITVFDDNLRLYSDNISSDDGEILSALDKAAELCGTHRYTIHLLFYICLSKQTRKAYEERNIPYQVFYDSMYDLRCKLMECHKMHGIWGSFVAWWFKRFFDLTRFALGRLQFETIEFNKHYEKNGNILNPGDVVLNIHIPSRGPFPHEACMESYRKAAEFYKNVFKGRPTAFVCHSWLLYPEHRNFLPENSNILSFMNDFDIISSEDDPNFGNLWRIFHQDYKGDISQLPRETSLQRAYVDWISKGNGVGNGFGVFFFDGHKVL